MLISRVNLFAQIDPDLKSKSGKTIKTPPPKKNQSDTNNTNKIIPQSLPEDSIKKVTIDSLKGDDDEEPLQHKIIYNARDSIRYETKGQKIFLFGDAYVEYEDMTIKAEYIVVDNDKNTIKALGKRDTAGASIGNPIFKISGQESSADTIIYNLKTKKGKIYNVMTKEGELWLKGSEVKKDSNDVVYMRNLQCIPCQFQDSKTIFRAGKAKIIPDDKIVTGPMYLEISGVPTPLGLPFGYFPNTKKRHSGILIPTFNNSAQYGFNLRDGGFYWGINDKTDMVIRSDVYANGSWGLKTINNYNINYKYTGSLELGYSIFNIGEKEIPQQYSKSKMGIIRWNHTQDQKNNPTIRFNGSVNVQSSSYNKFNADNTGQYLSNNFQSNINFTKMYKLSSLSVNARHEQNTQSKTMSIIFPELTFNVNRFFPFKKEGRIRKNPLDQLGISYLLEVQNKLSDYDSLIFKGDIGDKLIYGARHSVPISTNITVLKYFTLSPGLYLNANMTTKTSDKYLDYATNTIQTNTVKEFKTGYDAYFSTDLTTKLFMDYIFKAKRLKQVRHLLIPTLNYTYRPDYGAKQFGFYKEIYTDTTFRYLRKYSVFENKSFPGPPAGEQNSLGINLNNTLDAKIKKNSDTGAVYNKVQLLENLGLNGTYNFAADSFKLSVLTLTARTKFLKFFTINFNSSFDPYYYDVETKYRTKSFSSSNGGPIARFTTANLTIGASFSSSIVEAMRIKKPDLTNNVEKGATATNTTQSQAQLPWNLNLSYNTVFNKDPGLTGKIDKIETLGATGDISVTKYWKVGIGTGYDLTRKTLSYTSFNIYRDLKCWEARIDWVPFGFRKSYSITINLKTSMLSDAKIRRGNSTNVAY